MPPPKPGAKPDPKAAAKGGKKSEGDQDDIMDRGELKAEMAAARQSGKASCAFASVGQEGVLMVDRRLRPKAVLKGLKAAATKANMRLETSTIRFGRVQIGGSGSVTFVVNRETAPAMRPKLLEHLRAAGYAHLQIEVDFALEDEPEDGDDPVAAAPATSGTDQPATAPTQTEGAQQAATGPAQTQSTDQQAQGPAPTQSTDQQAQGPAPTQSTDQQAQGPAPTQSAEQPTPGSVAPDAGGNATAEAAQLARDLKDLMPRMNLAIEADPQNEKTLKPAGLAVATAIKAGELTEAKKALGTFRDLLEKAVAATEAAAASASTDASTAAPSGSEAPSIGRRGPPAPPKTIDNARIAWIATRQKVEGELDKLHTAFSKAFQGHHMEGDLTSIFRDRVDTVLDKLDANLAHTLQDLNKATDPAAREKLVDSAHDMIAGYIKHIDTDDTISQLDDNPFVPLAIRKTMEATLTTLSRAIR